MSLILRQSTTGQTVPLGRFVDATDGDTEETGLTIANTDIQLWKTGATTLADKNSGGATHIAKGIYYCVLDQADTATLGPLKVFVHVAGARPVELECLVLAANVYDSLVAASANLKADLDTIKTRAVVCAAGVTVLPSVGTVTENAPQTGDAFARLGAPAGASHAADVAAVKAQAQAIETDTQQIQGTLGVSGAGLTAIPRVGAVVGAVNSVTQPVSVDSASIGAVTGEKLRTALYSRK